MSTRWLKRTLTRFDMSFMEVHRVREIRFVPKHSNVISEVDPSETSGKKICNQVCTAHPSYDTGHSNWNCDEEIMPHVAIHVSNCSWNESANERLR
ncbi:ceramide kinase-like [Oncorhynchus nerka]|uniref:ceramide kinase-like n=1 Tax=Oncorhynchus nerka TaxID=8023 RepID=UPI0031B8395D